METLLTNHKNSTVLNFKCKNKVDDNYKGANLILMEVNCKIGQVISGNLMISIWN